jgi:HlyD family secretion protein
VSIVPILPKICNLHESFAHAFPIAAGASQTGAGNGRCMKKAISGALARCTIVKKLAFVLLLAGLAGCGLYFWWGLTGVQALQESSATFAEVRKADIRDTISATGMVEPREIVVVSAEMPGTIMRISPRDEKLNSIPLGVGAIVLEGAELARLDDRRLELKVEEANSGMAMAESAVEQARAALAQADANKKAADANLKVQKELQGVGGFRAEREHAEAQVTAAAAGIKVTEAGIKAADAKKQAAQTGLSEAKLALQMTRISVPRFSTPDVKDVARLRQFLILDRKANVGQMVGPQSGPLFTLAGNLDEVEVHAQVVEGDVNKIGKGLKAHFKVNNFADGETDFEGTVEEIRPLASNIKGAVYYNAVIRVKNRQEPKTGEWLLRPGMTAPVDIVRHEHKNAWRVPMTALNFTLEEAYQSDAVKARVAEWQKRPDSADWRTLWVWDGAAGRPQPIFIRIGARDGEIGLKDVDGNEILEWEPGKTPPGPLRVIIDAPKSRPPGFFDQPANVKI